MRATISIVFAIASMNCTACSSPETAAPPLSGDATVDASDGDVSTEAAVDTAAIDASDARDTADTADTADAAVVFPTAPPLRATTECEEGALMRLPEDRFAARLAPYAKGVVALAGAVSPTTGGTNFYHATLDLVAPTGINVGDFSGAVFVANADGVVTLRPKGQLARIDYSGVMTLLPYIGPALGATIQEAASDGEALWWTEDLPSEKEMLVRLPLGATVGTAIATIAKNGALFPMSTHVHVANSGASVSGGVERTLLRVEPSGTISTAPVVAHYGTIFGVDDDVVAWSVDSDLFARRRDGTGSFRGLGKGNALLSVLVPGAVHAVDSTNARALARLPIAEGEASTSRTFAADITAVAANGKQLFVGTSDGCVYSIALP